MSKLEARYIATVYPYTREFAPFCGSNYTRAGKGIKLHKFVAPKGMGIDGKDVGYIDNRNPIGFIAESNLSDALADSNTLFLVEGNYNDTTRGELMEHALRAIDLGKHIICGVRLNAEQADLLKAKCSEKGLDLINLIKGPEDVYTGKPKRLYRPQASVIFVGELLEGINGVDVAVALDRYFQNKSYRISTVLSSDIGVLCGAHSHKQFAALDRPADQQIDAMNSLIKKIEQEENPDLIIIQLPGGMMSFNDIATNHFGVYAYMWSQAVSPDYFVLCSPYKVLDEKKYSELSQHYLYRYGYGIDCIHISNTILDANNISYFFELSYGYVSVDEVLDTIQDHYEVSGIPTYCALDIPSRTKLCEEVESALADLGVARAL